MYFGEYTQGELICLVHVHVYTIQDHVVTMRFYLDRCSNIPSIHISADMELFNGVFTACGY